MLARLRVASRGALHNVRHITAGDAVRMQRRREGERLREAIGTQVSTTKPELSFAPKKMVLLARQIRRLSVPEAIVQMQFSKKRASYAVSKVIQVSLRQRSVELALVDAFGARAQNATNLADIRHGLSPEQLEVRTTVSPTWRAPNPLFSSEISCRARSTRLSSEKVSRAS